MNARALRQLRVDNEIDKRDINQRNARRAIAILRRQFSSDANQIIALPPPPQDATSAKASAESYDEMIAAQRFTTSSSCITDPNGVNIHERNLFILEQLAAKAAIAELAHQTALLTHPTTKVMHASDSGARKELVLGADVIRAFLKRHSARQRTSSGGMRYKVFAVVRNVKSASVLPTAQPITQYSWENEARHPILKGSLSQCDAWADGGAGLCDPCLARLWRHGKGTDFSALTARKCERLK